MRAAYQKSVMDIEAYQAAYPRDGAGLHNETNLFRAYLEILAWEQATVPTPDDPHGMRNVISRVQALYQKGKAAETAGNWQEARENYSVCCGYWGSIRQLHPQWRPEFVAEQQHLCLDSFIAVDGKIRLKNNHYIDPQLHTQLSV